MPHLSLVLGSATDTGAGECHVGYQDFEVLENTLVLESATWHGAG